METSTLLSMELDLPDEGIILFAASRFKIQSLGSLYEIGMNMIVNHFVPRAFFKFSISK